MKLHSHYCMSIHLAWYICISIYIYVPVFYVPEMKLHSHYFMSIHLDCYICISIYIICTRILCTRNRAQNCRLMAQPWYLVNFSLVFFGLFLINVGGKTQGTFFLKSGNFGDRDHKLFSLRDLWLATSFTRIVFPDMRKISRIFQVNYCLFY